MSKKMLNISYTGTCGHLYRLLTGKDHPKASGSFKYSLLDSTEKFNKAMENSKKELKELKNQTSEIMELVAKINEHNYCEICDNRRSTTSIALGTPDNYVDVCKSCEAKIGEEELDIYRDLEDMDEVNSETPLGTEFKDIDEK